MQSRALSRTLAGGLVALATVLAAHGQAGLPAGAPPPFPRTALVENARVVIHAPQIESWQNYDTVISWHAIEVTFGDESKPHVGAVQVRAGTQVNRERRTVQVYQVEILETHFPSVPEAQAARLEKAARAAVRSDPGTFPLDLVLSYLPRGKAQAGSTPVHADPPVIHVADSPAILVLIEGEPAFAPLAGIDLQYAVNTNWDLFLDKSSGAYYLLNWDRWLTAASLQGPWRVADALPDGFSRLPATDDWADVRAALPWKASGQTAPQVFVSTRPAELILTDGAPAFREIPDTMLAFVDNTDSDVFLDLTSNTHYLSVAGRWFKAPELEGPWEAAGRLPDDFARIPPDNPRGHVLVSVPGTWEARLVVMEAGIPYKARVDPTKATLQVNYHGEPQFEPIPDTPLARATNTPDQVIRVQQTYYACRLGVWFLSSSPTGPWAVANEVPDVLYTIPPASPAYPVTFVKIYGQGAGYVTFGYTAGYEQVQVLDEAVVYGTGAYYRPYRSRDAARPVYFPGFSPYGVAAYYEPYTSRYRRGARAYGPYNGWGRGALYDSRNGTYLRGAPAWGPRDATTALEAYRPYSESHAAGPGTHGVYGAWGPSVATRGHEWAAEEHSRSASSSHTYVLAAPNPAAETEPPADLYVGPDHDVYQHDGENWSRVAADRRDEGGPEDREQEIQDEQAELEQNIQDDVAEAEGWNVPPGGVVYDPGMWQGGVVVLDGYRRARGYPAARQRSNQIYSQRRLQRAGGRR